MLYVALIVLAIISLFLGFVFFFSQKKKLSYDKMPAIATAIAFFCFPIFLIISISLGSDKLSLLSLFLPISFILIYRSIICIIKYKNCTQEVKAEYVSYEMRARRRAAPAFTYKFDGETINAVSFVSYPNGRHKRLFSQDSQYNIYIDPKAPTHCADKRLITHRFEIFLALSVAFSLFGLLIVFVI